eukprot:CAMPEP_0171303546 /NCGR_PEP_ID=MMETSP0816-20121228/13074_1 /TAXON_ID=420281 /ORGANISM="Proboscia inermis, Strain CCAP1064/1" /LENGTH=178 /DNA_ID=CAMNT_0011782861 /DNA_START=74 /DNA_END=610 /DNA_ORIENTATION=+
MGKFVILPEHASNEFFYQFPNCVTYRTVPECVDKIQWALKSKPIPLSPEHARIFTWEAATERLRSQSILVEHDDLQQKDSVTSESQFEESISRVHLEIAKTTDILQRLVMFGKNKIMNGKNKMRSEGDHEKGDGHIDVFTEDDDNNVSGNYDDIERKKNEEKVDPKSDNNKNSQNRQI